MYQKTGRYVYQPGAREKAFEQGKREDKGGPPHGAA